MQFVEPGRPSLIAERKKKIPPHLFYERDLVRFHLVGISGWKDKHFPPRPQSDKANANWKRRKDAASNIFWSLAAWLEFEGLWISLASALAHSRAFCAAAVCRFLLPCNVLSGGPGEVTAYLIDGALTLGNIQITSRLAGVGGSQRRGGRKKWVKRPSGGSRPSRVESSRRSSLLLFLGVAVEDNRRRLFTEGLPVCQQVAPVLHSHHQWLDSHEGSSACHENNQGSMIKNWRSDFCFLRNTTDTEKWDVLLHKPDWRQLTLGLIKVCKKQLIHWRMMPVTC